MLVFDASASMAGSTWDMTGFKTRYDIVRAALADVLPRVDQARNLGLMIYGPGAHSCHNIDLRVPPGRNSAERILRDIDRTRPKGRTPLVAAVRHAAELLDYKNKSAVIVIITDGEDTCGGVPCEAARALAALARDMTIHVIGYAPAAAQNDARGSQCFASSTGGLYIDVETTDELVAALRKTMTCPQLSRTD